MLALAKSWFRHRGEKRLSRHRPYFGQLDETSRIASIPRIRLTGDPVAVDFGVEGEQFR